ncbi:unnamed protein product [Orchesella dallaii]|uniref:C-type lectin domain-containing protein n=1 Tax=Orchesella dallaii TaxID=48710 RepID=A0ABP1R657_9HEXA
MAGFKFFIKICIFTLMAAFATLVKTQMMPEYDDYPNPNPMSEHDYPHPPGMDRYGHGLGPDGYGGPGGPGGIAKKNEIMIGTKRFKLYEKKRLNFPKAKEFCRKKDGKLAEAKTIEEMRRLESLFMRARMIGMDVWVGADKKKWKKHSMKVVDHPGLNLSNAENSGIRAMMMGGGQKEMCPAISLSTRNLAPVMCVQPLPFICEYDRNKPRKPKPKHKNKGNSTSKATKKKKKAKKKDEMK